MHYIIHMHVKLYKLFKSFKKGGKYTILTLTKIKLKKAMLIPNIIDFRAKKFME
jgi:hypothetical protein